MDGTDDHLKPAKEESELDCEEEGVEQVQLRLRVSHREAVSLLRGQYLRSEMQQWTPDREMMTRIYLVRLLIVGNDPLGANNSSSEVGVNRQGDHLIVLLTHLATFSLTRT